MIRKGLGKMTNLQFSSPLTLKQDFLGEGVKISSIEYVGKINFRCDPNNSLIFNGIKDITGINLPLKSGEVFGNCLLYTSDAADE